MKWLKWLSLLVMGMLTITLGTVKAYAMCELATTPVGDTKVKITITNCNTGFDYQIRLYVTGTTNQVGPAIDVRANQFESGSYSMETWDLSSGQYEVRLFKRNYTDVTSVASFTIAPDVTPPELKCGDVCIDANASCPETCGPEYDAATGQWYCRAPGGYTPVPTMPWPTGPVYGNVMDDIFKADYMSDSQGVVGFLVSKLLPFVYTFAGLCLLVVLISGGLTLMTGAGDQNKVKEGYGKITAGLIGFLIIFVSYFIVQIVELILGVSIL